jgi:hypothetical protein
MAVTQLPRRDEQARAHLEAVARTVQPLVLARDRSVTLDGALAELVPGGAVVRGTVVRVAGTPGAGATTLGFELAAAFTAAGEWAAAVELDATLGPLAAAEAGVALERFAVVRRVPPTRWAAVVAELLDGVSLVLAEVPRGARAGDARQLEARVREREAVLVATEPHGVAWPAGAAYVVHASASTWDGLEPGAGVLAGRSLRVQVEGRGRAARPRAGELARAG